MKDNKHYENLEGEFKRRKIDLQNFLDSIDEEEDEENLYPALFSLRDKSDRYIDISYLAEGGEKVIESAFDSIAQRKVAFATPKDKTPALQERFLKEARLMAFLEHPNIMPVYDIGLIDDSPYFTMELIHGENLAKKRGEQKLSAHDLDEFLDVLVRVCDAVAFAHSKGIAHLDIKPQNIQMGPFGEVLLCDWGLSKVVGTSEDSEFLNGPDVSMTADLTVRGVLRGTPGYMSPSLSQGKPGTMEDDIYALGATLYYILTAKCPHFSEDLKKVIGDTVNNDPLPPSRLPLGSDIPSALEAVALKALSKKDAYYSVLDFRQELQNHLRGYATKAEEAGFITILKLLYKRQKKLSNTVLSSLIILICTTIFFISSLQKEKQKEMQAKLIAEKAKDDAESSLNMYKSELRYNRYLMEGIEESLKKIISEVNKKNLPVDIRKVLVKVGRGTLNGEAYEAAAQMLKTLAENSSGEAKNNAIHDLIFTKIFMHDFEAALLLLNSLSEEELGRAQIFQFIPICQEFKGKPQPRGVLAIADFKKVIMKVSKHERDRLWFFRHAFNCYLRKCNTDKEILDLYDVILDLKVPNRKYSLDLKSIDGQKTLIFRNATEMKEVHMPQILASLQIHTLDLRGTALKSLIFAREISMKEINIVDTAIINLKPLTNSEGIETIIVSDLKKLKGWRQLEKQGIQIKQVN